MSFFGRRFKKVRIPGGEKSWVKALPGVWATDPDVIVMLLPSDGEIESRETKDGTVLGLLRRGDKMQGIQILSPKLNNYLQHEAMFAEFSCPMARVHHVGKLSEIPDRILHHNTLAPLVLFRDAMWRPVWNLRTALKGMGENERN